MDIQIREIEKNDIHSVYKLLKAYCNFNDFKLKCYTSFDLLKEIISKETFVKLFVADLQGEIIGFILFNEYFDLTGRSIFIEDNFVTEEYRGKRIGGFLFSKVLEYALANKIEKIKWTVKERDAHFKKLYKEMGADLLEDKVSYMLTKKQLKDLAEKRIEFNSDLFKIRQVNNRDLPEIKYFIESKWELNEEMSIDIYDLIKYGLGENQLFKMIVLEVNDEIVGLMTFFDYFSAFYGKASHIQCTFVKDNYKSIGVGKILNIYLVNKLTKDKYNLLTIDIDKNDILSKNRMHFFNAIPIKNNTMVEMDNLALKKLINLK